MTEQVFVGREGALARLQGYLERTLAGQGQVAFVTGEAGAGKTALIREFAKRGQAGNAELVAAIGNCNAQTGLGDPYLPFREVLSLLLGDVDETLAKGAVNEKNASRLRQLLIHSGKILVEVGPDLVNVLVPGSRLIGLFGKAIAEKTGWMEEFEKLVQQKRDRTPGSATALEQGRILEEYTNVLKALALERPLLIVLDDLHWADEASVSLLFHLGRRIEQSRIMILGTYRPDEVAVGRGEDRHPLEKVLAEFKRYFGDITVNLDKVAESEGREFVNHYIDTMPNELVPEFREALYQHTGGHPLFTVELIRTMQERGDLQKDSQGRWVVGSTLDWQTLPARVEGVIEERIGRLEEKPRETLSVASVEGQVFEAQVVARVQEVPERESVRELTQDLEKRHRLVRELGELKVGHQRLSRFQFSHALFQQYLYNGLGGAERRLLHGEVAHVLEDLYRDDLQEITVQLARHYDEAGDDEKAAEYLIKAGDEAADLYAFAEARLHFTAALEALTHLPETDDNYRRRVDTVNKYVRVAFAATNPNDNLLLLMQAEHLANDLCAREPIRNDDRVRLARIHYWMGRAYFYLREPRKAISYFQQVLTVAQANGEEELLAIPMGMLGTALANQGEFNQAEALLSQAVVLLEKLHQWPEWILAESWLAIVQVGRGQYAVGTSTAEVVLSRAKELGHPRGIAEGHLTLSTVHAVGGDRKQMLEQGRRGLEAAQKAGEQLDVYIGHALVGWAQSRLGQHEAAMASITQSKRIGQTLGGQLAYSDWFATAEAEIAFNAGRIDEAKTLAEHAVTVAKSVGGKFSEAQALRIWGRALMASTPPRWEEAEPKFAESLRIFEACDARLEAARTHVAWGELCRARGDNLVAREHLEKATVQFDASGRTEESDQAMNLISSLA